MINFGWMVMKKLRLRYKRDALYGSGKSILPIHRILIVAFPDTVWLGNYTNTLKEDGNMISFQQNSAYHVDGGPNKI
jgi:hypothetical protein